MEIFLTSVLSFVLLLLVLRQLSKKKVVISSNGESTKRVPLILAVSAVSLLANLAAEEQSLSSVPLYLALTLLSLYSSASSIIPADWVKVISLVSVSLQILLSLSVMVCFLVLRLDMNLSCLTVLSAAFCSTSGLLFIAAVYFRLCDVRSVMRSGSVWTSICLSVDAVYTVLMLFAAVILPILKVWMTCIILLSIVCALCLRIRNESVFVLLSKHERRIVESMKISQVEFSGDSHGADQLYNNIYERVLRYFELHKPYLNSELTINDIVDVVYTNKLYISRAISQRTGRNFCQFVNYYRVTYAVDLFRKNPQMKVVEMANQCGFNSATSFSAAFRLYMGETPGDWCRKERVRLIKK